MLQSTRRKDRAEDEEELEANATDLAGLDRSSESSLPTLTPQILAAIRSTVHDEVNSLIERTPALAANRQLPHTSNVDDTGSDGPLSAGEELLTFPFGKLAHMSVSTRSWVKSDWQSRTIGGYRLKVRICINTICDPEWFAVRVYVGTFISPQNSFCPLYKQIVVSSYDSEGRLVEKFSVSAPPTAAMWVNAHRNDINFVTTRPFLCKLPAADDTNESTGTMLIGVCLKDARTGSE